MFSTENTRSFLVMGGSSRAGASLARAVQSAPVVTSATSAQRGAARRGRPCFCSGAECEARICVLVPERLSRLASDAVMPPNLTAFQLERVPSHRPCLRHGSAHAAPVSGSARMRMICSSVTPVRVIVRSQVRADPNRRWKGKSRCRFPTTAVDTPGIAARNGAGAVPYFLPCGDGSPSCWPPPAHLASPRGYAHRYAEFRNGVGHVDPGTYWQGA